MTEGELVRLRAGEFVLAARKGGGTGEPWRRVCEVASVMSGERAPVPGGYAAVEVRCLATRKRRLLYAWQVSRRAFDNEVIAAMRERDAGRDGKRRDAA